MCHCLTSLLQDNLSINPPSNNGYVNRPPASTNPFQDFLSAPRASSTQLRGHSQPRYGKLVDIFADEPSYPSSNNMTGPAGRGSDHRGSSGRRRRRNSESSVADRSSRFFDPATAYDEQQRRRRRHRDPSRRSKEGGRSNRSSKKPQYQLDIIDKLDVSSIYGAGMFHHDGPFDACNPSRNRKGLRSTPMEAFPEDSANNTIGGSGPINPKMNVDLYHGYTVEAHNDYSTSTKVPKAAPEGGGTWDAKRSEVVHGTQTMGLGTSTHLDGAPASQAAINQRREMEAENNNNNNMQAQNGGSGGGLQRKKSIAQRLRGISNRGDSGVRSTSVEHSSSSRLTPPYGRKLSFQEEEEEEENEAEANKENGEEKLSVPGAGITRSHSVGTPKGRASNERSLTGFEEKKSGGGLISRMKSLRKYTPERKSSDE